MTVTTGLVDTFSIPQLMRLIASDRLDPSLFATHRFAIGDTMSAFDMFADAANRCAQGRPEWFRAARPSERAAEPRSPRRETLARPPTRTAGRARYDGGRAPEKLVGDLAGEPIDRIPVRLSPSGRGSCARPPFGEIQRRMSGRPGTCGSRSPRSRITTGRRRASQAETGDRPVRPAGAEQPPGSCRGTRCGPGRSGGPRRATSPCTRRCPARQRRIRLGSYPLDGRPRPRSHV